MQNLAMLFKKIKTGIGGNREKREFENTSNLPRVEKYGVTPINAHQRRILGQLEFAFHLNENLNGKYSKELEQALMFLVGRLAETGVVSKEDALAAEDMILCMSKDAQIYDVIMCAHAHIDMNWMWSWQETVSAALETFRTMLALMDEYPNFCFSQSQASVYKIVEEYEPSMMEEIKQRIREGRWEVTAGAWVETDKNMPSTESLVRHILYTKKYLQETWGVPAESLQIDFSPDTFGHSANLPELITHGGLKYYYHCRANDFEHNLHLWRAPSGKQIMVHREPYWYNSGLTPDIGAGFFDVMKRTSGLKTGLIVYGVGDHGGGPTRRDVERGLEMMDWPVYPRLRFGTLIEYFKIAELVREKLPVYDREMNFAFAGCYTTQSRIKRGNKKSEAALFEAEALGALSNRAVQNTYNTKGFEKAWQNVLFTHFHDILTGSCVQDTREHAMGLYSDTLAIANTERAKAMRTIAQQIDTSSLYVKEDISSSRSEGAGVGYGIENFVPSVPERGSGLRRIFHVFNPDINPREGEVIELTIWDWTGTIAQVSFTDGAGNPLKHQLVDLDRENYWAHLRFRVRVQVDVPAMGYNTVVLDEAPLQRYPVHFFVDDFADFEFENPVLENKYVRAEFCYQTGALISFVDKKDGKELLEPGKPACLCYTELEAGTDNAWMIGQHMSHTPLTTSVKVNRQGGKDSLRQGLTIEAPFKNSMAKANIWLDQNSRALIFDFNIDFNESSKKSDRTVGLLNFKTHLNYQVNNYLYDVPAGSQLRRPAHMDRPGQTYAAAVNENGSSLAIITDCKYGYRGIDNSLLVSLIHASNQPDPYPERGIHNIRIALVADKAEPKIMSGHAKQVLHPLLYATTRAHGGTLPMSGSFLSMGDTSAIVSGIKNAEDGSGAVVRLYESEGKTTTAAIKFAWPVKSAMLVDILENPTGEAVAQGDTVKVELKPYTMAAVKVSF